ncbi:MAG: hypothetical protein FJX92_05440 [Bacteroidetes bacterium]|nr:hypothetical protein [Bacteroidota bacterium]
MKTTRIPVFLMVGLLAALNSCSGKKEILTLSEITDYAPLTVGKYITYRVDSLVFPNFGRSIEIRKYQIKHVIDAVFTDGMGRPSYRILRYQTDSTASRPWQPNGTYYITPSSDQLEVVEDNLRVLKLHQPLRADNTWKGNRFLPSDTHEPLYNFSNDDDMANWEFKIEGAPATFTYRRRTYNNVLSVEAVNDILNVPITNTNVFASYSRSVEKFAKNIGLVYRQHELWEHQTNTGGSGGPYKVGFGITQWMIDHN